MKDPILNELWNHMEFLGYKVEDVGKDKGNLILCRHENKSNIGLSLINETIFISARYSLGSTNEISLDKLFVSLNQTNANTMFTKWSCEKDDQQNVQLCIDTFTFGYEKQTFGYLLDSFESEINHNLDLLKEFLNL